MTHAFLGKGPRKSLLDTARGAAPDGPVPTPGKRTLTELLPADPLPIQRKAKDGGDRDRSQARAASTPSGPGAPLEPAVRGRMERLFGRDLSAVRIHQGDHATAAGAVAYTQGTDIHFAPGQYDPHSERGLRLLGHELAHVVQQASRTVAPTGEAGGHALNDDASLEADADQIGERVARGEPVAAGGTASAVGARTGGPIQRVKLILDSRKGWTRDRSTADDEEDASSAMRLDTSTETDPLVLFDVAWSIQDPKLANEVWADYKRAMVAHCTQGTTVLRLDKQVVKGRATVREATPAACFLNVAGNPRPVKVTNYQTLRPLRPHEVDRKDAELTEGPIQLGEAATQLVAVLRIQNKKKIAAAIDQAQPSAAQVALITAVTHDHGAEPNTNARSVFIKPGSWEDAQACYTRHAGKVEVTGDAHQGDRRAVAEREGLTLILREESASANTILATFEIQLGTHICEYKWQRTEDEQKQEDGRVAHWDPSSPIEQVRAAMAGAMIVDAATGPKNGARSGGSSGPPEQADVKTLEELRRSEYARKLKPGALRHLEDHPAPEEARLRFVNRNFVGSRIEVGNEGRLEDQDAYASIEPVRSYHQGQAKQANLRDEATTQLARLETETETRGKRHQGAAARGATALVSIKQRFWDEFGGLDEATQIERIDEALAPFGASQEPRIQVASRLPYEDAQDMKTSEPRNVLVIGKYCFDISSRHAYKFHEQSLESHPGHGGTIQEIELAIVQAAIARHLAGALPRMGAIGGIAESPYTVTVGGVRIAYLAWAAAPTATLIHISDYMALTGTTQKPAKDPDRSTREDDTEERMLDDAARLSAAELGAWGMLLPGRALRTLGHVPRSLLSLLALQITKAPETTHDAWVMMIRCAPAYLPDLIAECAALASPEALGQLGKIAIAVYGTVGLPDIVVATLACYLRRAAPETAKAQLETLGLAEHPMASPQLGVPVIAAPTTAQSPSHEPSPTSSRPSKDPVLSPLRSSLPQPSSSSSSSSHEPSGSTPYEILKHHSTLNADVPVGEQASSDESTGKPGKSEKPDKSDESDETATSRELAAHQMLANHDYEVTKRSLAVWLNEHGIRVVPNAGGGHNSCLIISLLQHASGDYAHPRADLVEKFKTKLTELGVGDDDALLPTGKPALALVHAINEHFGCQLKPVFIQAFGDQDPPYYLLETETQGTPAVIWDKLGHFEALTMKRS